MSYPINLDVALVFNKKKYALQVRYYPGSPGTLLDPPDSDEILDLSFVDDVSIDEQDSLIEDDDFYNALLNACSDKFEEESYHYDDDYDDADDNYYF